MTSTQQPAEPATLTSDGLMRSSAVMAAGTFVSRLLGFVRAAALLWAIGVGASGDAFSVANTVPNNLYILLAGGVLNAVLVPQITRAAKDPDGGREYVERLLTISLAFLAVVTVVVVAAAPLLVRLYAEGFNAAMLRLSTLFALWCLPQVLFYGLYTLLGQVLNARGSFGPYMWAPVVNNIVAIAGLVAFVAVAGSGARDPRDWSAGDIALLGGTTTLGVVVQALVLVPALRRSGFRWRPRWGLRGVGLRTASRVAGWTFAAVLLAQLGYIVTSKVATYGGVLARSEGGAGIAPGKASYDPALLLFMLPHSLITVSLVTALFTRMARAAAADRVSEVRQDLSLGLRICGVATVLATAAVLALGPELTQAAFLGSSRAATDGIAFVTMAMIVGLVPFSAQYLMQRVFYVFEDARTPFLVQVPVVLTWTTGNLLALWLLPGRYVVVGIGVAMSVSNIVGALIAAVLLRRRIGRLDGGRVVGTYARLGAAALAAGLAGWGVARVAHATLGDGRGGFLAAALAGSLVLVTCYVVALRLLRVTELDELVRPLLAPLRARRVSRGV